MVPLALRAWEAVVVRTSHAFHRRGANRNDSARLTFNVDLARLAECPEFVDVDTLRSLSTRRVCSMRWIDELEEQDISLAPVVDGPGCEGEGRRRGRHTAPGRAARL